MDNKKWNEITNDLQVFYDYVKPKLEKLMERADCEDEHYCFEDFYHDYVDEFHEIREVKIVGNHWD